MVLVNSFTWLSIQALISVIVHSTFGWGPCPSVFQSPEPIVSLKESGFLYSTSEFSAIDFLGLWFDIYRNIDFTYAKGNCTQALYYISPDNKIIAQNSELVNQVNTSARAEVFIDPSIQGQLYAKFFHFAPAGDYKVVHTDYGRTSLIFSCTSLIVAHKKFAWILGRNINVKPPDFYFKLIEDFGIPLDSLQKTIHENCES